uniref:Uncharacterized protein n=1 Tax=Anopheles dirus TaxID=7168 RepID=A0A182NYN5_9DIPT
MMMLLSKTETKKPFHFPQHYGTVTNSARTGALGSIISSRPLPPTNRASGCLLRSMTAHYPFSTEHSEHGPDARNSQPFVTARLS